MDLFPSRVCLYNSAGLDSLEAVMEFIKDLSGGSISVELRDDIINCYLSRIPSGKQEQAIEEIALNIAQSKVRDLEKPFEIPDPLPGEVLYEKKRMINKSGKSFGLLYDGFMIMKAFSGFIPESEQDARSCHIVLTDRLIGTRDENDLRYHARVSVCGYPSVISIPGIVEAPAKPKEFYLKQQLGADRYMLKHELKDQFIDHENERIMEIVKGYVLQVLFYTMTGYPFCEKKACRLFNAHRQKELIHAQIESGILCEHHKLMLERGKE